QQWADQPVLQQGEPQDFRIGEYATEQFITNLRERRIHHQYQTDRDRNVGRSNIEALNERGCALEPVPDRNAGDHRQENPERQVAIEKRELASQCFSHARSSSASAQGPAGTGVFSSLRGTAADLIHALFDPHTVERRKRQTRKNLDSTLEFAKHLLEQG